MFLCKNRTDSFASGDSGSTGDVMLCQWRADSFAEEVDKQASFLTNSSFASSPGTLSAPSPSNSRSTSRIVDRRQEVAYLEALSFHASKSQGSERLSTKTRSGRTPRQPKPRRSTIGVPSTVLASHAGANPPDELDRYEAMQQVSREAAIREILEREMQNHCRVEFNKLPTSPAAPSRSRGCAQPFQPSARQSPTPRSRSSLHVPPPQKLQTHPTEQRAASLGANPICGVKQLPVAGMFARPVSLGATVMRSASFGQVSSYRLSHASPAGSRAASFDLGVAARRGASPSSTPRVLSMGLPANGSARVDGQFDRSPRSLSPTWQVAAAAVEQAQLAARLNAAAEMVDSVQVDHSVLDEAKRLTELHTRRQAQQQQHQPRATPSSSAASPLQYYVKSPTHSPAKARPSSPGHASVFWTPPPEAMPACTRPQGYQCQPANGTTPSSVSFLTYAMSEQPRVQQVSFSTI